LVPLEHLVDLTLIQYRRDGELQRFAVLPRIRPAHNP
jgi:hypothetical protein